MKIVCEDYDLRTLLLGQVGHGIHFIIAYKNHMFENKGGKERGILYSV